MALTGRPPRLIAASLTPEQSLLRDQVRAALTGQHSVREVPMFGGLSFMVDKRMIVAAQKTGDLLVRVDPEQSGKLLDRPGTHPAEMGQGRSMGLGWLIAEGSLSATQVTFWVGVAMEHCERNAARV